MAYIAVKNTEHKGVYKEEGFNKDIYKTKGISYRRFDSSELDNALKWAGVKNIKGVKTKKKKTKKKSSSDEKLSVCNNTTFDAIMDYKNKGFEGVCLITKTLGDIYLKLNDVNMFIGRLEYFDKEKDSLVEHIEVKSKEARLEKEKYGYYYSSYCIFKKDIDIIKFKNLSEISLVNEDYLRLSNFWVKDKPKNLFEKKELFISSTIRLKYNTEDFRTSYNDFTIDNEEIISIQPLEFLLPEDKTEIGKYRFSWYNSAVSKKITSIESNKIEKIFAEAEAENLIITEYK